MRLRVRDNSIFTLPKKARLAVRQGDLFKVYKSGGELVLRPVGGVVKRGSVAARIEEMRAGWDIVRGRFTHLDPDEYCQRERMVGGVAASLAEEAIASSGGDPEAAVEELREAQQMIGDSVDSADR